MRPNYRFINFIIGNNNIKPIKPIKSYKKIKFKSFNKGIGAGGSNTNKFGKSFETLTDNVDRFLTNNYTKVNISKSKSLYGYFLYKKFNDKKIIYIKQYGFVLYMKYKYNIDMIRWPDEAFIIEYENKNIHIKILEKKHQNVEGSVETKLWSGFQLVTKKLIKLYIF